MHFSARRRRWRTARSRCGRRPRNGFMPRPTATSLGCAVTTPIVSGPQQTQICFRGRFDAHGRGRHAPGQRVHLTANAGQTAGVARAGQLLSAAAAVYAAVAAAVFCGGAAGSAVRLLLTGPADLYARVGPRSGAAAGFAERRGSTRRRARTYSEAASFLLPGGSGSFSAACAGMAAAAGRSDGRLWRPSPVRWRVWPRQGRSVVCCWSSTRCREHCCDAVDDTAMSRRRAGVLDAVVDRPGLGVLGVWAAGRVFCFRSGSTRPALLRAAAGPLAWLFRQFGLERARRILPFKRITTEIPNAKSEIRNPIMRVRFPYFGSRISDFTVLDQLLLSLRYVKKRNCSPSAPDGSQLTVSANSLTSNRHDRVGQKCDLDSRVAG